MRVLKRKPPFVFTKAEQEYIVKQWKQHTAKEIATALNEAAPLRLRPVTPGVIYAYVRRVRRVAYTKMTALLADDKTTEALALRERLRDRLPNKQASVRRVLAEYFSGHVCLEEQ